MSRKTIDVEQLKLEVNRRNKHSTCDEDVRRGWNSLLELVLHATGNYRGFNMYTHSDVPAGKLAGIVRHEDGRVEFPDDSRRFYY